VFIVIYTLIWLACSLTICLFSFFAGRCARKLPVIDDGLPWVLHRSHVPYPNQGPACMGRQTDLPAPLTRQQRHRLRPRLLQRPRAPVRLARERVHKLALQPDAARPDTRLTTPPPSQGP
jgi:hypothetical protein